MSEYTREEILRMIEEVGGPENLDLSGKDLSGIDLSKEAITEELERFQEEHPGETPVWFSKDTGGINLHHATFKKAVLRSSHLQGAVLWSSHLQGAVLREAHLEGATFGKAHLEGAYFGGAHLEGADFYIAESLAGAYFYRAWLNQTFMTKEQLSDRIGEHVDEKYYRAKEAYLRLKNNFNQIGRYDDASWAYRKERRMERMTHRPDVAWKYYDYPKLPDPLPSGAKRILHRLWLPLRKARFHLSHLVHYLFDTAQLALCDFGENPWLVLIWAGVALFLFGLAYMAFGGLGPGPGVSSAIAFGDHFVYSLFAFATMDHPRIVATSGLAQFLTAFEALVGIFLAAIFVFTLGNRISRS